MTCECGKVRYLTRGAAKQAARLHRHRKATLRVYRCEGGFWHLTSVSADSMAFLRRARRAS